MDQLDLFEWKKAPKTSATVYRFPLARREDMVRSITSELLSRDPSAGRRHWNAHVQKVRRQLRSEGLIRDHIDSEIRDYALAVRFRVLSSSPMSVSR
jgi:hypothetical protein